MTKIKTITPHQLQMALHDGRELALLDVREEGEFGEAHLLFATPLPYSRLELRILTLVPRPTVRVVLCDDGSSQVAHRAAHRLAALGYTDISILGGGTRAWAAAGYTLFKGVNVPSKLFGELVEHVYETPRIKAEDLVQMQQLGEDVVLLDARPFHEHQKATIPGSICCPSAELPYRINGLVKNSGTKIVIHCAGRTRSILGAQTLINFGIPNPVYALENGTQGWSLANLDLEYGSQRKYPGQVDADVTVDKHVPAQRLMRQFNVLGINAALLNSWLKDTSRTTYLCDVRTREEFAAGTLPGAQHAPGGQLVQATDQWIGVRHARIVLFDGGDQVRAPVVASWLAQLGHDVYVLEQGIAAAVHAVPSVALELPVLPSVDADALQQLVSTQTAAVLDLRSSVNYRKQHLAPSTWSIRTRIAEDVASLRRANPRLSTLVFVADAVEVARLASSELAESGITDLRVLRGGIDEWVRVGLPVTSTPDSPPDRECIDYLFFVHDRHDGNRSAMQQYLAWETGLLAQLSAKDKSLFSMPEFPLVPGNDRSAA